MTIILNEILFYEGYSEFNEDTTDNSFNLYFGENSEYFLWS